MPVTGKTRAFGAGPFGFAGFGTWRLDRAAGRAPGASAADGGVLRSRVGMGQATAAAATMGSARNPKASGGTLTALSDTAGGVRRDGSRGACLVAISDALGGGFAVRGGFGQVDAASALRGRLRLLWDRPDDTPEDAAWNPVVPGGGGPWQPIPMPGAPAWQPQQPTEI